MKIWTEQRNRWELGGGGGITGARTRTGAGTGVRAGETADLSPVSGAGGKE